MELHGSYRSLLARRISAQRYESYVGCLQVISVFTLNLCFNVRHISLSDRSNHSHDARQKASAVFWFCMQQLQISEDVLSADFHPDWQQQQQGWPTFVQQVHPSQITVDSSLPPIRRPEHAVAHPALRLSVTTATSPRTSNPCLKLAYP
jgi:hypothetical protein